MAFRAEKLGSQHDRTSFSSRVQPLDRYFRQQASQDQRRGLAQPYVLVDEDTGALVGYYTLSSYGITAASLPEELTRRLARYPIYPAMLIGRLALGQHYQGRGLGKTLLADALKRCLALSEQVGTVAVVVDAKDDAARGFYEHFGFRRFQDDLYRLFLPMKDIGAPVD